MILEPQDSRMLEFRGETRQGITMPPLKTFKGTSKNGNVQKALDLAIQAARQAAPGADRLIEWTLKEISGRDGGITGLKEATVVIKARVA
jgi:hypothetical protein